LNTNNRINSLTKEDIKELIQRENRVSFPEDLLAALLLLQKEKADKEIYDNDLYNTDFEENSLENVIPEEIIRPVLGGYTFTSSQSSERGSDDEISNNIQNNETCCFCSIQ